MVWVAKAAVPRVSGEERTVAEVLHTLPAEAADAAGVSEPGDADPVAEAMCRDVVADEVDAADDFMSGNDRIFDVGKLRIDDMKVGPADPARAHLDANFAVAGDRVRALLQSAEASPEPATPSHASMYLQAKADPDG